MQLLLHIHAQCNIMIFLFYGIEHMLEKKSAISYLQKEATQETGKVKVLKIIRLYLDLPLLQVLDPVTLNQ